MGIMSWFTGSNPAASVASGAVTGLLDGVGGAANKIREAITGELSAEGQAKFNLAFQELHQSLQLGQQAINLADANSDSNFRGGWRPAIGWSCAMALFFYYVPPIMMATALWSIQCVAIMWKSPDITTLTSLPEFPKIMDIQEILGLVLSLLGMGVLRSVDKNNNSAQ